MRASDRDRPFTRTPRPPAWLYWSGPSKLRMTKTMRCGSRFNARPHP